MEYYSVVDYNTARSGPVRLLTMEVYKADSLFLDEYMDLPLYFEE